MCALSRRCSCFVHVRYSLNVHSLYLLPVSQRLSSQNADTNFGSIREFCFLFRLVTLGPCAAVEGTGGASAGSSGFHALADLRGFLASVGSKGSHHNSRRLVGLPRISPLIGLQGLNRLVGLPGLNPARRAPTWFVSCPLFIKCSLPVLASRHPALSSHTQLLHSSVPACTETNMGDGI